MSRIRVKNRIESPTNKEKSTGPTGCCKIYPKFCNIGYDQCQRPTGAKGFLILETTFGSGPQVHHQSLGAVSPSVSRFITLRARGLRGYLGCFFSGDQSDIAFVSLFLLVEELADLSESSHPCSLPSCGLSVLPLPL